MGYYMCIIEVFHLYFRITLIANKININTPLLSHSDTTSNLEYAIKIKYILPGSPFHV